MTDPMKPKALATVVELLLSSLIIDNEWNVRGEDPAKQGSDTDGGAAVKQAR